MFDTFFSLDFLGGGQCCSVRVGEERPKLSLGRDVLLGVTTEALRVKTDPKSAICKRVGAISAKFSRERDLPTNHFCTDR